MSAIQLKMDAIGSPLTTPEVDARQAEKASSDPRPSSAEPSPLVAQTATAAAADGVEQSPERPKKKNRCAVCNKKVGLLGFECKCGRLLCTSHRQAEEHQCDYDYRSEGKKRLEAANPLVTFPKLGSI
jgi:hypothetical protein